MHQDLRCRWSSLLRTRHGCLRPNLPHLRAGEGADSFVPRSLHCRDCKCQWHGLAYLCRRHGLNDILLYIKKNHFGVSKIVLKSYVEAVEAGRGFDLEMELQRLHAVGALPDGLMRPAAVAVQETQ